MRRKNQIFKICFRPLCFLTAVEAANDGWRGFLVSRNFSRSLLEGLESLESFESLGNNGLESLFFRSQLVFQVFLSPSLFSSFRSEFLFLFFPLPCYFFSSAEHRDTFLLRSSLLSGWGHLVAEGPTGREASSLRKII